MCGNHIGIYAVAPLMYAGQGDAGKVKLDLPLLHQADHDKGRSGEERERTMKRYKGIIRVRV